MTTRRTSTALILSLLLLPCAAAALDDGLARTPPMGWNACNAFGWGNNVNEALYKQCADSIISTGMRDAGYVYVNQDAGWSASTRDANGDLQTNTTRFPSGMKGMGDYLHARGLKFGIYNDVGTLMCGNSAPGTAYHEYQDAAAFARWGVDYVKNDFCNAVGSADSLYSLWHAAVTAAGRPMVLELCEWGVDAPWSGWGGQAGHLWRTTTDITPQNACFDCKRTTGTVDGPWGPIAILEVNQRYNRFAGPGHWNFPDMMVVGNPGLTDTESKAHFALWCIMAAPLIAGNDVRNMSPAVKSILLNREMIAVDQDSLGVQGQRMWIDTANSVIDRGGRVLSGANLQVYVKPMRDSSRAVVMFNKGDSAASMTLRWVHLGWPTTTRAAVRDLWLHRDMGVNTDSYSATVGSHDVVALRLTPETVLGVARATASPGSAKIARPRLAVIVAAARPAPDVGTYSLCGRRIAGRAVEAMGVVVLAAGVQ